MIEKQEYRKALGRFATGITVITVAKPEGGVHGMTANSFTSVSLAPLLILVCVDERAHLLPLLTAAGRFGVSVLNEDQQAISELFARPYPEVNPDVRFRHSLHGTPLLEGVLATLDCKVVDAHVAGDHTIFIGEVEEISWTDGNPLLYYGGAYRKLSPA
jgi:flavin reductase (DIM6/NTAB) family NADH-FMN oxidoreductase RutF